MDVQADATQSFRHFRVDAEGMLLDVQAEIVALQHLNGARGRTQMDALCSTSHRCQIGKLRLLEKSPRGFGVHPGERARVDDTRQARLVDGYELSNRMSKPRTFGKGRARCGVQKG